MTGFLIGVVLVLLVGGAVVADKLSGWVMLKAIARKIGLSNLG